MLLRYPLEGSSTNLSILLTAYTYETIKTDASPSNVKKWGLKKEVRTQSTIASRNYLNLGLATCLRARTKRPARDMNMMKVETMPVGYAFPFLEALWRD